MARHLLSDAEVLAFLQRGYHVCEPDCPVDLLEAICRDTDAMHDPDRPKLPSDATDMFGNPNDLFRRVPGLDALLRNPVIQGALTSLVGERCRLEVHRASHYLAAGHGGQQFHQDGQFRSFGGGWNRHYRRWQLPRKVIAFFYPHDVQLNQAHSEAIPGSQVYSNVPPALEADPLRLNVKAGTFVIMHQNLWHRGTKELVGERRIMLKVLYDRTNEPTAPSWNHKAAPAWTDELLSTAPWVKSAWDWMAGDHTAATDDRDGSALTEQQTALLLSQLAAVAADESTALRSAYTLGRLGAADLVDVLLDRLEAAAAKLDPESPEHKREHQIAVSEETMIGTALTSFGLRGVPKVCERIASCAPSDAEKAHFKALALDCLTDTPGALANEVALECFARCLGDPSAVSPFNLYLHICTSAHLCIIGRCVGVAVSHAGGLTD
jgi:hypothetical protein